MLPTYQYDDPVLRVAKGSGKQVRITLKDRNCTPVDLSNLIRLTLMVKLALDDEDPSALLVKQIPVDDADHDLPNGIVVLKFEELDTRFIPRGNYLWDLRGERSSGSTPFFFPNPPGEFVVAGVCNLGQTPPGIVTDFVASDGQDGQVTLTWTNPTDLDLAEVVVRRQINSYPENETDGDLVYRTLTPVAGDPVTAVDLDVVPGTTYYYTVFSRDSVINWQAEVVDGSNADTGVAG